MLKAYGIKNIVLSPGTRNSGFSASVQSDPYFQAYSVVDERGAGYFATGLAFETDEPVVICCTGATASRNYLSALTEAYYRRLPIIALTFGYAGGEYLLTPQFVDRSVSQNDVKLRSVTLPKVEDERSRNLCELMLNDAFIRCAFGRRGPVHVNVLHFSYQFSCKTLPDVTKVSYVSVYDLMQPSKVKELVFSLAARRVGVFIGSHNKMSAALTEAISAFAEKCHAPIFTDHTSNYHGSNKVLIAQICDMTITKKLPDLLIDMGGICGQYSLSRLFAHAEVWRLSEGGGVQQRAGRVTHLFDCREDFFFQCVVDAATAPCTVEYYAEIRQELERPDRTPSLFSGIFVARHYARHIPEGCSFHSSILNSLRSSNFFSFPESINHVCNVGGFGIDGALSTLVGQSVADRDRLYFAQVGDLAFFYDMNALGNRHVGKNIRILLVNNGLGAEFVIDQNHHNQNAYQVEPFIAACGHNGHAEGWARSCGFHYMTASNEEEFLAQIEEFCHPDVNHFDKPVLFEVFTKGEDEFLSVQAMKPESVEMENEDAAVERAEANEGRCSTGVRLLSCFIPSRKKRHAFRRKHSK